MKKEMINQAQQFNKERFTKVDIIKNPNSHAFLLNFLPGQQMKPHNHPGRELYLCVMEGKGIFSIDGEEVAVTQGDVIYCDPEEKIGFINSQDSKASIYGTMTKIKE